LARAEGGLRRSWSHGAPPTADTRVALEEVHRDHARIYGQALRDARALSWSMLRVTASDASVTDEQRNAWLSGTVMSRVGGTRALVRVGPAAVIAAESR
jgi:hypothetical protein